MKLIGALNFLFCFLSIAQERVVDELKVRESGGLDKITIDAPAISSPFTLTLPSTAGAIGDCLGNSGVAGQLTFFDCLLKVSANDTTGGYLNGKLVAGTGITLTENNDGGNETLTVASTVVDTDELASVSANDTTPGYLNGKLIAGTNITLTENNDGGNETLTISSSGSSLAIGNAIGNSPASFGFLAADGAGNLFNDDSYTFSGSGPIAVAQSVGKTDFSDSRSDLYVRATDDAYLQALCNGVACEASVILDDGDSNAKLKMGDDGNLQLESTGPIYAEPTGFFGIRNSGKFLVGNANSTPVGDAEIYKSDSNSSFLQFSNLTTGRTISDGFQIGLGSDEKAFLYNAESTDMDFYTAANLHFKIDSNGDLLAQSSKVGGQRYFSIRNTDNTNGNSHTAIFLDNGGTAGGDAYTAYTLSGENTFTTGVDNTDNTFRITAASGLGGTGGIYLDVFNRVGIGDNTPDAPLDIQTSDNNPLLQMSSTGLPDLYWLQIRGESGTTGDYNFRVSNNGVLNDAFRIFGSGAVNIPLTLFVGLNGGQSGADTQINRIRSGNNNNATYVGQNVAGASTFFVLGTGQIYSTSTSIALISDRRHKEKIRALNYGLGEILQLEPKRFKWKQDFANSSDNQLGFIAQDVRSVMPELILKADKIEADPDEPDPEKKKSLAIKTGDLIPVLVNAIKELKEEVDTLKARVDALEGKK